ncbi:MAG TPA: HupE/UreJ family protein [Gemmatimonadales bacterium]|jgi:hypothetical protein|nr:HupE/UreJ family protein [Gemmatimonadales bacterium]
MSDFAAFLALGFRHITAPSALDHLLFLVALVAPYRLRDWRHLLGVASAFTVGHSITLALVVTGAAHLPTALIEFLIPVTIVCAGLENLRNPGRRPEGWVRPVLAAGFGLIHGAGFANFLREMFTGGVAVPLVAFNLGIELGQMAILGGALLLLTGVDRAVALRLPAGGLRVRAVAASLVAAGWAAALAAQRAPW